MNWRLLANSLLVSGATTLVAVVLGAVSAFWLSTLHRGWRRILLGCAVLSLALPPFLVTNSWLDLFGQTGRWRAWLPFNIYSMPGTVWILTLLLWPISLLLVLGDLQKLEPSQLEADPALRSLSLIRWLLLPLIWPALRQSAVIIFVLALNNFAVPAILQTKVFPAELWVNFNTTFDYASALQLSWPLLLFPLLVWLWLKREAISWPRFAGGLPPELLRRQLGNGWYAFSLGITVLAMTLALIVPLGDLALSRRTWLELPDAWSASRSAVLNSFVYAASASGLCAGLGLLFWRCRLASALWLLFLLPGVLLGMALIFLFNRAWLVPFYQSGGIVLTALCLRYAALSWTGVGQAMRSTDSRLTDFARLNGATAWDTLRHVYWPQIASAIGVLAFVVYLLCLWDVETLVLIIPPGGETLALRIFNLLHYGHATQVNALCVLLLALAVLPLLLFGVASFGRQFLPAARGSQSSKSSSVPNFVSNLISHLVSLCLTVHVRARRWKSITRKSSTAFCFLFSAFLSGCGPSSSNQAPIQSRIFSRVEIIGTRGTGLGQFNKPRSLAVDAQDNLYVVDMTGRVQKFSSNGVFLSFWQMPQIEKGKPKGMCRDSFGNIVVVEPHYNRVNHFTPEGKMVAQWGTSGTNSGQLCLPRSAIVDSHGDVLVCEYTAVDRVQRFSALGKHWKQAFGRSGLGPGELNRPEGLAVDNLDQIYVADSCNHRIQVFSPDGKFLRTYGHAGSGLGELSYPYDIKLDRTGLQFVCEFGNSRLQVFDQQDRPIEIIGGPGFAPGQFSNPWCMALDSAGNLYVTDSLNHRVQKFIRRHP